MWCNAVTRKQEDYAVRAKLMGISSFLLGLRQCTDGGGGGIGDQHNQLQVGSICADGAC